MACNWPDRPRVGLRLHNHRGLLDEQRRLGRKTGLSVLLRPQALHDFRDWVGEGEGRRRGGGRRDALGGGHEGEEKGWVGCEGCGSGVCGVWCGVALRGVAWAEFSPMLTEAVRPPGLTSNRTSPELTTTRPLPKPHSQRLAQRTKRKKVPSRHQGELRATADAPGYASTVEECAPEVRRARPAMLDRNLGRVLEPRPGSGSQTLAPPHQASSMFVQIREP